MCPLRGAIDRERCPSRKEDMPRSMLHRTCRCGSEERDISLPHYQSAFTSGLEAASAVIVKSSEARCLPSQQVCGDACLQPSSSTMLAAQFWVVCCRDQDQSQHILKCPYRARMGSKQTCGCWACVRQDHPPVSMLWKWRCSKARESRSKTGGRRLPPFVAAS